MKVKEFIEKLNPFDGELEVIGWDGSDATLIIKPIIEINTAYKDVSPLKIGLLINISRTTVQKSIDLK